MKIGIITYHWAVNYGAVLQAYALQTYLQKLGYDVEFINYVPNTQRTCFIKNYLGKNIHSTILKWKNAKRKLMFKSFVSRLNVGDLYTSYEELLKVPPKCDVYICGSDQIWNYDLVKSAFDEEGISKAYYLGFGDETIKRIAFAPSFGSCNIADASKEQIIKYLSRFNALSVREQSGVKMLESLGFRNVKWISDPTFLLHSHDYLKIEHPTIKINDNYVYAYILEEQEEIIKKVLSIVSDRNRLLVYNIFMGTTIKEKNYKNIIPTPEQWLHYINKSDFVVTNSFHSIVFAIIFHIPFISVPLEGKVSGRNERIVSLLNYLGLSDRILWKFSEEAVLEILNHSINWMDVDNLISKWREEANDFLKTQLLD